MVGIPFLVVLSWELYQRQFLGKEQKRMPREPREALRPKGSVDLEALHAERERGRGWEG